MNIGTVTAVERLNAHMTRVVLGGPGLDGFADPTEADSYVNALFLPEDAGYAPPFQLDEVKAFPPERRPFPRRITVRHWEPETQLLTLDIAVHDGGHAGRWAAGATVGDTLQFKGPGGGYSPDPEADWYLFAGDESAIPAIAVCAERVPEGAPVVLALEVESRDDEFDISSPGDLRVHHTYREGRHDPERLAALVAGLTLPSGRASMFVHGEAESIRAVRRQVLGAQLVRLEDLSFSPYWRQGYSDEQWRSIKRDWVREVQSEA